jgi:hypothetical protein
MDAEFLDRREFLQGAAGRPVTVVSGDTGMKIRARGSLGALKLLTLPDEYRVVETDQEDGSQGGVIRYRALADSNGDSNSSDHQPRAATGNSA